MNSELLLRRKNIIVLPNSPGTTNAGVIAAANLNLQDLGYTLSAQAINHLKNTHFLTSKTVLTEVLHFARTARGEGAGLSRPMYPDFPAQVAEAADSELYLSAILHYFSVWLADVAYNEDYVWLPKYRKSPRASLSAGDKVKLTVLKVVPEGKVAPIYREIQKQLVTSNTSTSEQDKKDIRELVNTGFLVPNTTEIPNKENLAVYAAALLRHKDPVYAEWFKHGTDVLRLATALSDGDVSLAKNTKFISFSRFIRRTLLFLLAQDENIQEAFSRDRERFIRLGERLHPSEFKGLEYRKLRDAFLILRSGVRLETFNGEVEELIKKGFAGPAATLLSKRPGEYARRLDHLLNIASPGVGRQIIHNFLKVVGDVSTPVLLQLMKHFQTRNVTNMRVVTPKGEVSKIYVVSEKPREPLNIGLLEQLVIGIQETLVARFSELDSLGNVYVDPALKSYLVPFNQRSASASLRTIVRGSRVPFGDEKDTLRFFIHWKNTGKSSDYDRGSYGRVDLDLSTVMYDADWNNKGAVWYGNLRNYGSGVTYKAVHSGDITDAPNGAAEFIDVDIPSMLKYGIRYIAMTVNKFAGPATIAEVPECFAGWMLRNEPQSGEVFEPKTVVDRIDLTSPSQMVVPMIIDLQNREVIWVDSEVSGVTRWGSNVRNQKDKLATVGKALTRISKTNLHDLFMLHAQGRGKVVKREKQADTVFSVKNGIQFDLAKIASEYLGD